MQADLDRAVQFLTTLFLPGDFLSIRPIETWTEAGRKASRVDHSGVRTRLVGLRSADGTWSACPDSLATSLRQDIERAEKHRTNLFFGVCPRFGSGGRYDQAWQVRTVRCLWTDLDDTADPAEARRRCEAAGLPPASILVGSGNGLHLYWLLCEAFSIDDAGDPPPVFSDWETDAKGRRRRVQFLRSEAGERISLEAKQHVPPLSTKALWMQDILKGLASQIGGDHTTDLARLLRIPGTLNHKDARNGRDPRPCQILHLDATARYPLSAFAGLAEHSPDRSRRERIAHVPLPAQRKLSPHGEDRLNELILACHTAEQGYRSEADYAVVAYAIEKGVSRDELWRRLSGVGKFAEESSRIPGGGERYFAMTWDSAAQRVRENIVDKVTAKVRVKVAGRTIAAGPQGSNGHAPQGNGQASQSNGHAAAVADIPFDLFGDAEPAAELPELPAADPQDAPQDADPDSPEPSAGSGEPISNVELVEEGDRGEEKAYPLPINQVLANILDHTGDWPRRVGSKLFIHDSVRGICWLDRQPALFGWLASRVGVIDWRSVTGCVTKEEAFSELRRTATAYDAIEHLPHEPRMPGHYYACEFPEPGDGSALEGLLDRFSPATLEDRQLIKALFATVFWGGGGGSRPAFVVTADSGRGSGKSKLTEMVALLAGGLIELAQHEAEGELRKRLLSPEGLKKRIARFDNVKSLKLSWSGLESLITTHQISGRPLYDGEATRPNNLTWCITLNGISLSTDMAQRSVVIHVTRPEYQPDWEETTVAYIRDHQQQIIGDIIGFLRSPAAELPANTRWAAWEQAILARLDDPAAVQAAIIARTETADTEREEIELIEEFFGERLADLHYDLGTERVHVPAAIASRWYNEATGERRTIMGASKILRQFIGEERASRLQINHSRKYGRGLLWVGESAEGDEWTNYDLPDRIARLRPDSGDKQRPRQPETEDDF